MLQMNKGRDGWEISLFLAFNIFQLVFYYGATFFFGGCCFDIPCAIEKIGWQYQLIFKCIQLCTLQICFGFYLYHAYENVNNRIYSN